MPLVLEMVPVTLPHEESSHNGMPNSSSTLIPHPKTRQGHVYISGYGLREGRDELNALSNPVLSETNHEIVMGTMALIMAGAATTVTLVNYFQSSLYVVSTKQ